MKRKIISILCMGFMLTACSDAADNKGSDNGNTTTNQAEQNLNRAIEITDKAVSNYFTGDGMAMARYYNPYTNVRSAEKGSVWMYTSSIEAVNAIMHALQSMKDHGKSALYDQHFSRYSQLLKKLYDNAAYYKGTFSLTSYTQTKSWNVYGVDRGGSKGTALVDGIHNVYDDQQWLIRELITAYKLTNDNTYLNEAEYLTSYVLDGWDCVPNANGKEYGGITWGPGYLTKHSCSNGPFISSLVWLYELYKDKTDQITYLYINTDNSRQSKTMKKSDYYLQYAKAVYDWQKTLLIRPDGVYDDMMGGYEGSSDVQYETINGVRYRKHTNLNDRVGPAISYNSGTMLSGAADLYRVTNISTYLDDINRLTKSSFSYFAKKDATLSGYYTYDITGFNNWFNGVLLRGYIDAYPAYKSASTCINTFQQNIDYGYSKFIYNGMLPTNLLVGWSRDNTNNSVEAMFTFAFAAEYATLARYEIEK